MTAASAFESAIAALATAPGAEADGATGGDGRSGVAAVVANVPAPPDTPPRSGGRRNANAPTAAATPRTSAPPPTSHTDLDEPGARGGDAVNGALVALAPDCDPCDGMGPTRVLGTVAASASLGGRDDIGRFTLRPAA